MNIRARRLVSLLSVYAVFAGCAVSATPGGYSKTDSRFKAEDSTIAGEAYCPARWPKVEWEVYIDRVVTLPEELNSDGTLKNPQKLIDNGVIQKNSQTEDSCV
jgi:hypothetical protein